MIHRRGLSGIVAVLLALLVLLFLQCCTCPAQAATTVGEYAGRLSSALAAVRRAEHERGAARKHDLALALRLLPPTLAVSLDGTTVQADLHVLRADVEAQHVRRAAARLEALRVALDVHAARPPGAPAEAPAQPRLGALDRILARPPFTTQKSLWQTIGDVVGGLIMRSPLGVIVDAIKRLLSGASDTPIIPILAGLIVAVALIFVAGRSFGHVVPRAGASLDETGEFGAGARLDAAAARARAATLAAGGDFREAARYLFLATLLALDEAGKLRIDSATGNRDVLRQARAVPRLAEALTPVVRGFELFWFGHLPVTQEEYERYRRLSERVLEAAR